MHTYEVLVVDSSVVVELAEMDGVVVSIVKVSFNGFIIQSINSVTLVKIPGSPSLSHLSLKVIFLSKDYMYLCAKMIGLREFDYKTTTLIQ